MGVGLSGEECIGSWSCFFGGVNTVSSLNDQHSAHVRYGLGSKG